MTQWLPHSKLSARFEARAGGRAYARVERGIHVASSFHYEGSRGKSTAVINGTLMRAEARAPYLRLGFATAALRSSSPA